MGNMKASARCIARIQQLSKNVRIALAVGVAVLFAGVGFVVLREDNSDPGFIARGAGDQILMPDDPMGSPHFALTSDFDPSVNTTSAVPAELKTDADDILTVKSATFVDGEGPYVLNWKLKNGDSNISCLNCALLDARVKRIIAAVLASGSADGIDKIVGVEPARTLAGDYSGNGWQAEFVVGASAKSVQAGEKITTWLLENSVDNKVLSVLWQNLLYSSSECGNKLLDVPPVEAYPNAIPTTESAQRDAAMDRVTVASPTYIPQFEDRDGAQFLTGWKTTSC
jgi:hypothetical protein